jgi:hypothetical protein
VECFFAVNKSCLVHKVVHLFPNVETSHAQSARPSSGDLSLTIRPGLTVTKLTLDADRDVPLTTVIRVAALRTKVMHCYNAVFPQT